MSGEVPLPGPRSHVYVAKRAGGISGVSFIRALDPSHLPEDLLPYHHFGHLVSMFEFGGGDTHSVYDNVRA